MLLIHLFILFFIGIPLSLLIWLGGFLLKRKGYTDKLKAYYKYSFLLLLSILLFLFLFEESFRTHQVDFMLNETIQIDIIMVERESFLDNPTDFTFKIRNLKTGQNLNFEFFRINRHPYIFYLNEENKNQLIIYEEDGPTDAHWIINLQTLEQQDRTTEFLAERNFKLIEMVRLTHFDEIKWPKPQSLTPQ